MGRKQIELMKSVNEAIEDKQLAHRLKRQFFRSILVIIIVVFIVYILLNYVVGWSVTSGDSMLPTITDGEVTVFSRIDKSYDRGEVVIIDHHKEGELIKRIIGVPGDLIDIKDGKVYVNGKEQAENYIYQDTQTAAAGYNATQFPCAVNENEYFVLGDNREVSLDSRYTDVGKIKKSEIVGAVKFGFGGLNKQ